MTDVEQTDELADAELDSRLRSRLHALDDLLTHTHAPVAAPVRRTTVRQRQQSFGTLVLGFVVVGIVAAAVSLWRPASNGGSAPQDSLATAAVPPGSNQPQAAVTAEIAEAFAREHVLAGATLVAAVSGRFADVFEPLGDGVRPEDASVPANSLVWVVTFTEEMTICAPPYVIDGKEERTCFPPRQATVRVVLDFWTGAYLASSGMAPAP